MIAPLTSRRMRLPQTRASPGDASRLEAEAGVLGGASSAVEIAREQGGAEWGVGYAGQRVPAGVRWLNVHCTCPDGQRTLASSSRGCESDAGVSPIDPTVLESRALTDAREACAMACR